MAFSNTKLTANVAAGGANFFQYRDTATDTLAGIKAADFFVGGAEYGMKVNDPMWIEGTDGAELVRVSAINAAGAATVA